jgi:transposase
VSSKPCTRTWTGLRSRPSGCCALLQSFYSVRSKRLLMEQVDYNLLYRWIVGLGIDAAQFLAAVLSHPRVRQLLSSEDFMVDGTSVEAWASLNSFWPKDDRV